VLLWRSLYQIFQAFLLSYRICCSIMLTCLHLQWVFHPRELTIMLFHCYLVPKLWQSDPIGTLLR
jgi:hypothetical protein